MTSGFRRVSLENFQPQHPAERRQWWQSRLQCPAGVLADRQVRAANRHIDERQHVSSQSLRIVDLADDS